MVKYSSKLVDDICALVRAGNTHRDAAALNDISEDTFYEWKKKRPEFSEALKKAELQCKQRCIAVIQRAAAGRAADKKKNITAKDPIWTAAAWWMERRYAHEYAERKEISGPGGGPIVNRDVRLPNLSPDVLKKLASMAIPEANGSTNGHDGDAVAGSGI